MKGFRRNRIYAHPSSNKQQPLRRKMDRSGSFPSIADSYDGSFPSVADSAPAPAPEQALSPPRSSNHHHHQHAQKQQQQQQQADEEQQHSHGCCLSWKKLSCVSPMSSLKEHSCEANQEPKSPQNQQNHQHAQQQYHSVRYHSFHDPSSSSNSSSHGSRRSIWANTRSGNKNSSSGGAGILTRSYVPVKHSTSAAEEVEDSWDSNESEKQQVAASRLAAASVLTTNMEKAAQAQERLLVASKRSSKNKEKASASEYKKHNRHDAVDQVDGNKEKGIEKQPEEPEEEDDDDDLSVDAMLRLQKRAQAVVLQSNRQLMYDHLSPEIRARAAVLYATTTTPTTTTSHTVMTPYTKQTLAPMTPKNHTQMTPFVSSPPIASPARALALHITNTNSPPRSGGRPPLPPNHYNNQYHDDDDESPYSSEFMTDDSSESSGLPVDTSTSTDSQQQATPTPREQLPQSFLASSLALGSASANAAPTGAAVPAGTADPRIGIRPIEPPPILDRTAAQGASPFDSDEDVDKDHWNCDPPPFVNITSPNAFQHNNNHHHSLSSNTKHNKSKTTTIESQQAPSADQHHHQHLKSDAKKSNDRDVLRKYKTKTRLTSDNAGFHDDDDDKKKNMESPPRQDLSAATVSQPAATAVTSPTTKAPITPTRPKIRRVVSWGGDGMNLYIPKATRSGHGEHSFYEEEGSIASTSLHSSSQNSPFRPVPPRVHHHDLHATIHNQHDKNNVAATPHAPTTTNATSSSNSLSYLSHLSRQVTTSGLSQPPMEERQEQKLQHENQVQDDEYVWRNSSPDPPAKKLSERRVKDQPSSNHGMDAWGGEEINYNSASSAEQEHYQQHHEHHQQHVEDNDNNNNSPSPPIPLLSSHHHAHENSENLEREEEEEAPENDRLFSYDDRHSLDPQGNNNSSMFAQDDEEDQSSIQRTLSMKSVPATNKMQALINKFEDFGKAQASPFPRKKPTPPRRALNYTIAVSRRENRQDTCSQASTTASSSNNSIDGDVREGGHGQGVVVTNQHYSYDRGHDVSREKRTTATAARRRAAAAGRGHIWRNGPESPHDRHYQQRRSNQHDDEAREDITPDPELVMVNSGSSHSSVGRGNQYDHHHHHHHHHRGINDHRSHDGVGRHQKHHARNDNNHHIITMIIDPDSNNNRRNTGKDRRVMGKEMRITGKDRWNNHGHVIDSRYLHV